MSVWGDLAKTVDEHFHAALEKPIIAVVTSTKLNLFRSMFTNFYIIPTIAAFI